MSHGVVMQSHPQHPSRRQPNILSALLFSAGLAIASIGQAETPDNLTEKLNKLGYQPGESVERVEHYRVDGWNYIDNKHIVIYAGPSKRFLITTMNDCSDLNWTERIGFTSTVSYLTRFDKVIVRGSGGMVRNCPIKEINALTKTTAK